ncbi:MAG: hypothetical protein ABF542_11575, partial [Gluconobacter sp.]
MVVALYPARTSRHILWLDIDIREMPQKHMDDMLAAEDGFSEVLNSSLLQTIKSAAMTTQRSTELPEPSRALLSGRGRHLDDDILLRMVV